MISNREPFLVIRFATAKITNTIVYFKVLLVSPFENGKLSKIDKLVNFNKTLVWS